MDEEKRQVSETQGQAEPQRKRHEHHGDTVSALVWALILMWVGVVLLLANLGLLQTWADTGNMLFGWTLSGITAGALIAAGIGLILIAEAVIRLSLPQYRRSVTGTLILAGLLLALGLQGLLGWTLIWPIVLIAIGLAVLVSSLVSRT